MITPASGLSCQRKERVEPPFRDKGSVPDHCRKLRLGPCQSPVDRFDESEIDRSGNQKRPFIQSLCEFLQEPLRFPVASIVHQDKTGLGEYFKRLTRHARVSTGLFHTGTTISITGLFMFATVAVTGTVTFRGERKE